MQVSNAIAWGQFQLRGGLRGVLMSSVGYLAVIGMLIFASYRLEVAHGGGGGMVLRGWTAGLMGIQLGVAILFGCWLVGAAVRKDISSKMIESHRLMPVSATDAVVGYLVGAGSSAIAIGCANFLLGLVIIPMAVGGVTTTGWLLANAVVAIFALSAWSVMAFLPLAFPFGTVFVSAGVFILLMGHEVVPPLAPGVAFLFGPLLQDNVFGIIATARISPELQLSLLAQLLVGLLCCVGMARKYRRDDVLAWGPVMGVLVVASYVLISATGISLWDRIRPPARIFRMEQIPVDVQLELAAIVGLLVAIIPVAAAARLEALWRRRRSLHDPAPNPRPMYGLIIVVVASACATLLMPMGITGWAYASGKLSWSEPGWVQRLLLGRDVLYNHLRTFAVYFAFLASMSYLLRLTHLRDVRSRWVAVLFVALLWLVPILADTLFSAATKQFESGRIFTAISGASPLVALVYIWSRVSVDGDPAHLISTTPGITAQLVIAILLAAIYYARIRTFSSKPATPARAAGV